jgi:hypothetical protein
MERLQALGINLGEVRSFPDGSVQYYNIFAKDKDGKEYVTLFAARVCYTESLIRLFKRFAPVGLKENEEEEQNAE